MFDGSTAIGTIERRVNPDTHDRPVTGLGNRLFRTTTDQIIANAYMWP